jgi:hypothetical protein
VLDHFPMTSIAVRDLDRDGRMDLIGLDIFFLTRIYVFLQTEVPGQVTRVDLHCGAGVRPHDVGAEDLDGNGYLDVFSANPEANNLTVFYQFEDGFREPPDLLGGTGVTNGADAAVAADLDGDGRMDLVSANDPDFGVSILVQNEEGGFDFSVMLPCSDPYRVAASDIDGDLDLDVIVSNRSSAELLVFTQNSPGVFELEPIRLPVGESAADFVVVDLDRDGERDLVAADADGDSVVIYYGGDSE